MNEELAAEIRKIAKEEIRDANNKPEEIAYQKELIVATTTFYDFMRLLEHTIKENAELHEVIVHMKKFAIEHREPTETKMKLAFKMMHYAK